MSEAKIYKKMVDIMSDLGVIGKGRYNKQQDYKFRGIDDIVNEANPVFKKHGVFVLPDVLETIRETHTSAKGNALFYTLNKVKYIFMADDGSSVSATAQGEGMDSGDKSSNKAMTSAFKNALTQTFLIPTSEPKDSENDHYEDIKPKGKPKGSPAISTHPIYKPTPDEVERLDKSIPTGAPKLTKDELEELRAAFNAIGIVDPVERLKFAKDVIKWEGMKACGEMDSAMLRLVLAAINKRVDEGVK